MNQEDQKQKDALKQALLVIKKLKAKVAELEQRRPEPIAVVGMGCRFPGGIADPDAFWQALRKGRDTVSEIPVDRWDVDRYHREEKGVPGTIYTRKGGFLDNIDCFDPSFFNISPKEAASMDPQQRMVLEVAWEALENAGIDAANLVGSQTGVFLGQVMNDYGDLTLKQSDATGLDAYSGTG
ncbi:MAG: polyketide synthase, partial [Acidobacteriota bacterium]|nr:polyketide synthase [Acidobacteriota bacterium]